MRRAPDGHLKLSHALALGVLHGPAELLPVSSSAHTTLVPWLLGWSYPELDPELRKAFEVALHAGTAAALLVGLRDEVAEAARGRRSGGRERTPGCSTRSPSGSPRRARSCRASRATARR
jgi:undecaprenyl pyrophosphate phosphatase UppP